MSELSPVCQELLTIYRERGGCVEFWAEPLNALTNASFLIASGAALDLAIRRQTLTRSTAVLISLAGTIGIGSFVFHTVPNQITMWLDIIPIALFQVLFLWFATREMLAISKWRSAAIVIGIVGMSFALRPIHQPLNGSLFYVPSLIAMLTIGIVWAERTNDEPFLLVAAAACFLLAVTARSTDWLVPWHFGTHFLWHLLNGVVVYLALRAWVVSISGKGKIARSGTFAD